MLQNIQYTVVSVMCIFNVDKKIFIVYYIKQKVSSNNKT